MPLAITLYHTVLAIHILAVVVAFGATFAYGLMFGVARGRPEILGGFYRMVQAISRRLIQPGLGVILIAGIYLASKADAFSKFYVQWGFAAVIVLGALEGALIAPALRKGIAVADEEAGGEPGSEHRALIRRVGLIGGLSDLIVVATIFVMATKPFS